MPRPPATSPITACQSPARWATRGLKPARAAAGHEHLVARPADRRRDPALPRELREVDARAARQRVVGGSTASSDVAEQVLAVEAGVVAAAARREHSIAEDHVDVAGDEHRHRLGRSPPRRIRSVTAGATARSGRAAGASRPASAVGKPPIRTSPRGAASCAASSPSSFSSWANSASAWPSSTCAAGVSRTLRPAGSSSGVADLALQRRELLGDRGRREMQRVGGRGERAVVGDGAQRSESCAGRP